MIEAPVEAAEEEPAEITSDVAQDKADEIPAADESTPVVEESDETAEQEAAESEEATEQPEIKIETAPADFRFPTTNQTRHCFTRYIEYHRCIAAKGEDAPECNKFAKYYRALCPGEWVDRWNEQRENGTFPGPL
ncbi:cytochrome c oxidase subunit 6b-3-like [Asparagus officinalis]|nr:cytochrome c oxidase subunit 6b-3-like [Asparagus officinalis]